MIAGQTRDAASAWGPTPLVWAPAWLVAVVGAMIVVAGFGYLLARAGLRARVVARTRAGHTPSVRAPMFGSSGGSPRARSLGRRS